MNLPQIVLLDDENDPKKRKKLREEQMQYLEELKEIQNSILEEEQQKKIQRIDYDTQIFTLHLNSEHADEYVRDAFGNPLTSGYRINIEDTITNNPGARLEIGITHAEIPKTWFNVDTENNQFNFYDNTVFPPSFNFFKTLTIKPGHYTFNTLASTLSTLLTQNSYIGTNYTVTYDEATHTFLFVGANALAFIFSFDFNVENSSFRELGFNGSIYDSTTYGIDQILESVVSTRLSTSQSVYITTNLNTKNIYHPRTSSLSNVLAKIPVKAESKEIIYYEMNMEQMSRIDEYQISSLTLGLVDEFGRYKNLNGHHWSCTLKIIVYPLID